MRFVCVNRYQFQPHCRFPLLLTCGLLAAALQFTSTSLHNSLIAQDTTAAHAAQLQLQPEQLQQSLEPLAVAHAGEVAISVRVLDGSNQMICHYQYHGQRVMPTASLIKLPIMIEAYRQASLGPLSLTDMLTLQAEDQVPGSGILTEHFSPGLKLSLRDAIRLMIRYSDNTATNMVVDHIGLPSTAQTMADLGWPETRLHSKVFRRDTTLALERSELYGLGSTTADDMTELLVRLAQGQLVSAEASQAMLEHLQSCDDTLKLPRYLPKGFTVAHKTGSVNRSRTAAGIISGPGIKFAICVLTDKNEDESWSEDNAADMLIGRMASAVVELLQGKTATTAGKSSDVKDRPAASSTELATLRLGAAGAEVETLQRTLNARSDAGLGVDGDFGSATEDAVKKFQVANKLAASGIVDGPTWSALGTLVVQDEPVPDPEVINAQRLPQSAPLDPHAPPEVTATAWASVDMASGKVFGGKKLHQRLHIASTTKVMTALLVVEAAERDPAVLDELVTFSKRADNTLGSTSGVRAGEKLPVKELLYGLLLPSGNDASVALAEHFGSRLLSAGVAHERTQRSQPAQPVLAGLSAAGSAYDQFIEAMNHRAAELGMSDTHFVNPHGLPDDSHLSSAADLAKLARAAWQLPLMREIVRTRVHAAQVHGAGGAARNLRWVNTNQLLAQQGFSGMKTGTTTAAGACLIAVGMSAEGQSDTIVVVLGSSSSAARYVDARNVFAWTWRVH